MGEYFQNIPELSEEDQAILKKRQEHSDKYHDEKIPSGERSYHYYMMIHYDSKYKSRRR